VIPSRARAVNINIVADVRLEEPVDSREQMWKLQRLPPTLRHQCQLPMLYDDQRHRLFVC
jgi:hypothetical protein